MGTGLERARGGRRMIPVGATAPRTTLADYVVGVIREKTASGELRPGEHLREAELAAALGVSRGPVRGTGGDPAAPRRVRQHPDPARRG